MGVTVVTGASGFIGRRLVERLARERGEAAVVSLSRKKPEIAGNAGQWVRGSFDSFEDLRGLDGHAIDAAVHLAAVTGGCSEEEGIAVNVAGTRRFLRYLLDRGCRRFVVASSIAAVGALTPGEPRFAPLSLPMRPDHPCVGRDAYGLSKAMMEDVVKFFARSYPEAGFVNLRFGAVTDEGTHQPSPGNALAVGPWAFVLVGRVALSDVVDGVVAALDALARGKPGFHSYNLVGPDSALDVPVAQAVREALGTGAAGLDLSAYERPGHEHDPLWSIDELRHGLGFTPRIPMRPSAFQAWKEQKR
jgi:UDP-glucose 4-epimerase